VWGSEVFQNFPHRKYAIVHGSKAQRLKALNRNVDFFIINHDGIKTVEDELILLLKPDIIIVDEMTAFKNAQADRSKCARRICNSAKGVWGMSGNPTPNCPTEAFGQAKLVRPDNPNVPKYFTKFKNEVMTQINQFLWVPKPGTDQYVAKMLSPAIRYKRSECIDLPPCSYQTLEIGMNKEQQKMYSALMDEYIAEHEQGEISASNAGVRAIKLLQVTSGAIYNDDRQVIKINVKNKLDELDNIWNSTSNKKLIVFSSFKPSIDIILGHLRDRGISAEKITGDVSMRRRSSYFDSFQSGSLQVLVVQPQAASHGLTLTASSTIVWFTPIPSGEVFQQANARITRPGQKYNQLIIKLIGSPAEARVYKALDNKENMSHALLELFT
jgi:SNF2 family DNA or RNA helicase